MSDERSEAGSQFHVVGPLLHGSSSPLWKFDRLKWFRCLECKDSADWVKQCVTMETREQAEGMLK